RVELERGVVDEDVDPAELVDDPLHGIVAEGRVAHVARDGEAAPPLLLHRAPGLLGVLVLAEVEDGDVGSLTREEDEDRAADARVAAGDDRDHVAQLVGAAVVGRLEARRGLEHGLAAGLLQVLRGERELRLRARAHLHRAVVLAAPGLLPLALLAIQPVLDAPLLFRRAFGRLAVACHPVARHCLSLLPGCPVVRRRGPGGGCAGRNARTAAGGPGARWAGQRPVDGGPCAARRKDGARRTGPRIVVLRTGWTARR